MSELGNDKNKVVNIPPRTELINHKGLHATLRYNPNNKKWNWVLKTQYTVIQKGSQDDKATAILEAKGFMEIAAASKNVRSID